MSYSLNTSHDTLYIGSEVDEDKKKSVPKLQGPSEPVWEKVTGRSH